MKTVLYHRHSAGIAAAAAITAVIAGVLWAPPAGADPAPAPKDAVDQVRGSARCGPLRYDPVVEHTADIVNRSTDVYVSHTAKQVPVSDPLPIFKDLGGTGGKAISLLSATGNDADTIEGVLLAGYAAIPDCSYTSFGASMLWNADAGKSLAAVVLVGP